MKMFFMCWSLCICTFQPILAILPDPVPLDVRSFSLGHLHALSHELTNPAYLSFQTQKTIHFAVLNHFEMPELNTPSMGVIVPNHLLDCGLEFSSFHFSEYQLLSARAGFSKKLASGISMGINFLYCHESMDDHSNQIYSSDLGFHFQYSPKWSIALLGNHLLNSDGIRPAWHAGVNITLLPSCHLLIEPSWRYSTGWTFSAGFEYELMDQFMFRAGVCSNPSVPCLGIAYTLHDFHLAAGFGFNTCLGANSAISIAYSLP